MFEGDFAVFPKKDAEGREDGSVVYNVTKPRADTAGKKHYPVVGKMVLRPNGNGTLFLHALDGDFAIFPKRCAEDPRAQATPAHDAR